MANPMRRLSAILTMTALVGAVLVVTAAPAIASAEGDLVAMVNRERTSRGLSRLAVASDLVAVARRHSARMAANGQISHNPAVSAETKNWEAIGENVGSGRTATRIHNAFMDSVTHRANIVRGRYTKIGIGVVSKGGVIYVTQVFVQRGRVTLAPAFQARRSSPRASSPIVVTSPPKPIVPESRSVQVLLRLVHR